MSEMGQKEEKGYMYPEVPARVLRGIYPNPPSSVVSIAAVFDKGAYEAGTELQKQTLAALSILLEDSEAKADIQQAMEEGYYFALSDYYQGPQNETNDSLKTIVVVHDYRSQNLVKSSEGYEAAASHVFIGRHELRHSVQPEELNSIQAVMYTPLDAIKMQRWGEADAEAEAVAYGFSDYIRKGNRQVIEEMMRDRSVFHSVSIAAMNYYEGLKEPENKALDIVLPAIRAEAFLAWMRPEEGTKQHRELKKYDKAALDTYEKVVGFLLDTEKKMSAVLDGLPEAGSVPDNPAEMKKQLNILNQAYKNSIGVAYTDPLLALPPREISYEDLKILGNRKTGGNYFTQTDDENGDQFRYLANGGVEDVEKYSNIPLDKERIAKLSQLRQEFAELHKSNMERIIPKLEELGIDVQEAPATETPPPSSAPIIDHDPGEFRP